MAAQRSRSRNRGHRRFRLLRAYTTTLRVLLSYLILRPAAWLHGPDWKSGALLRAHRRNARLVVRTILDLKGLFIKIGQLISILTNFLPEDFRKELEGLQDHIPPGPFSDVAGRIRNEFGKEPAELFANIDESAIASASLAQVHEAELADGRRVAVKVQHPDIEEIARIDLRALRRILGLAGMVARIRGLSDQASQLERMIMEELDFAAEANHIESIAANFEGDSEVGFPDVIHDRSTTRVLTTTLVEGIKVSDLDALDAQGIDRTLLAERIVRAYCKMIFSDGLYHADPHPGNIIVKPNGNIVFIDFGAVARLSRGMMEGLPQALIGIFRRDGERIVKAFRQMGLVARDGHEDTVTQLVDYVHNHLLADLDLESWKLQDLSAESVMEKKMEALSDFRTLDISFRDLTSTFQVPKDWILLERTVALLTGLCTHLDPQMNPIRIIRPYVEHVVLGPEKDWKQLLSTVVRDVAVSAISLPDEFRRLMTRANRGEVEVQIRDIRHVSRLAYALGHQFLYALLTLGTGGLAYAAYLHEHELMTLITGGTAGLFALLMLGSLLAGRKLARKLKK